MWWLQQGFILKTCHFKYRNEVRIFQGIVFDPGINCLSDGFGYFGSYQLTAIR